jgi:preprotein translocase subunit SecE
MVLILAVALGCVELYVWLPRRGWLDGALIPLQWFGKLPLVNVPLSIKFLLCLGLFVGLLALVRWTMSRPSTVATMIETELEMKKVSWPTRQESLNAMWVVVLVTVVLTATLASFDTALHLLLRFVF